jgi:hypothetical protein
MNFRRFVGSFVHIFEFCYFFSKGGLQLSVNLVLSCRQRGVTREELSARRATTNERTGERERVLEVARSICKRHPILEEFLPSCARSALVSATLVINNNLKEESTATNNL